MSRVYGWSFHSRRLNASRATTPACERAKVNRSTSRSRSVATSSPGYVAEATTSARVCTTPLNASASAEPPSDRRSASTDA